MHQYSLYRVAFLGTLLVAGNASVRAQDCENLLIPDVALVQMDVATDLSYLAIISPENFQSHRKNASGELHPKSGRELFQTDVHLGVDLPIAKELLLASTSYEVFDQKRAEKYQAYQFNYPKADVARYYALSLPEPRASRYAQCINPTGLTILVTKADRDYVELAIGWKTGSDTSAEASLAKAVVSGGVLQGSAPAKLKSPQHITLGYLRDLDKDFRFATDAGSTASTVFVPSYMNKEPAVVAATARCASAEKVVSAAYRQVLERQTKPAQLAKLAALLTNKTNSVRQLVELFANGTEYADSFVKGKTDEAVLRGYYRHILVREPDAAGLAYNTNLIRSLGYAKIAMQFEQGLEYQRSFGEWIVPGEPARIKYCGK